jgi:hypothetical protein
MSTLKGPNPSRAEVSFLRNLQSIETEKRNHKLVHNTEMKKRDKDIHEE